ncbi:MAG: L,D-transpeptidase family protein [Actinomycetota bacterium]
MLTALLITIALGITAPVQSPEAADAVVPNRAPVSIPIHGVRWLSPSLATTDGALVQIIGDRPALVGHKVVNPAEGAAPAGPGTEGVVVARLQTRLSGLNLFRGNIDGIYGRETAASVVAFHKLIGVDRSDRWSIEDWNLATELDHGAILARNPSEADRVEVDIARQLLFVVRDNDVTAVVPVSTGNGATYWSKNGGPEGGLVKANTPRGDFTLFRHIPGWRINYMGGLYKPWYFTPYYAIHGSKKVPAQPASHGCVRIPTWEADHLDDFLEIGLPVHIWEA